MKRIRFYLCAVVVLICCLCNRIASAQVQQFAFQDLNLQEGERAVGIELSVTAGSFVGFDPFPMGWYFIIDNDPSQQTSIKGDARVGAAALQLQELSKLRLRVKKVEFEKRTFSISGTLILTKGNFEAERRMPLVADNFKLVSTSAQ